VTASDEYEGRNTEEKGGAGRKGDEGHTSDEQHQCRAVKRSQTNNTYGFQDRHVLTSGRGTRTDGGEALRVLKQKTKKQVKYRRSGMKSLEKGNSKWPGNEGKKRKNTRQTWHRAQKSGKGEKKHKRERKEPKLIEPRMRGGPRRTQIQKKGRLGRSHDSVVDMKLKPQSKIGKRQRRKGLATSNCGQKRKSAGNWKKVCGLQGEGIRRGPTRGLLS